jgi:hypothetical protein
MSASTIEGPSGARLEHEQFPHLTRFEWEGLHRLSQISGEAVITARLSTGQNKNIALQLKSSWRASLRTHVGRR